MKRMPTLGEWASARNLTLKDIAQAADLHIDIVDWLCSEGTFTQIPAWVVYKIARAYGERMEDLMGVKQLDGGGVGDLWNEKLDGG